MHVHIYIVLQEVCLYFFILFLFFVGFVVVFLFLFFMDIVQLSFPTFLLASERSQRDTYRVETIEIPWCLYGTCNPFFRPCH